MQVVVKRHNRLALDTTGKSPIERFASIDDDIDATAFHTFGCPVFVLEAANQSGYGGTPKWEPRSHTGIYLGRSPSHASSVALVLNLKTGLVSPQYHVVFDDRFSTVPYLSSSTPPPNWPTLIATSRFKAPMLDDNTPSTWLHPTTTHTSKHPLTQIPEGGSSEAPTFPRESISHNSNALPSPSHTSLRQVTDLQQSTREETNDGSAFLDPATIGLRKSSRLAKRNRINYYGMMVLTLSTMVEIASNAASVATHCFQRRASDYNQFLECNFDGSTNSPGPLAQIFLASKSNNEVYTFRYSSNPIDNL